MGAPERVLLLRPRTVLGVAAVLLALAIALWIVWVARQVLTWVFVALFLGLALNPAVEWLRVRGMRRRGAAIATIFLAVLATLVALSLAFLPKLVDQAGGLADAVPGYVRELTTGRGPLGFLETKYHVVERARDAARGGGGNLLGGAGTVLSLTRGVITAIVGFVTIVFLTLFMLLEGPTWVERGIRLLPADQRPRWRLVGQSIARTVSGYVTGNLLLSVVAGVSSTLVMLVVGVPYSLPLGLLVAILDLIPLAGATLAGLVLALVGFLTSTTAGIVLVAFFVLYQQLENHVLQPLVYGRTVQLSPLVVLISILVGSEVAGVLGALAAIPVAGALQILLVDWLAHRRGGAADTDGAISARVAEPTGHG